MVAATTAAALVFGTAAAAAAAPAAPTKPAANAPTKPAANAAAKAVSVVGSLGSCTTAKGALVAVDFGHWSGPVVRECGTKLTTGRALLTTGGFSIAGTVRFPGFVCRLGHALWKSGAKYPTTAQDPCVNTPPATAYWSYWTAAKGKTTWTYSPRGLDSDVPANGEVEAWAFGAGAKPRVSPAQVRAGLPAGKATAAVAERAAHNAAIRSAAGSGPDAAQGADYLIASLTDGDHAEQFGLPDIGLTIDVGLALAATGAHEDVLGKITDYVAAHQNDYTFLTGPYAAFASGGYAGKVALLAEVAGRDPRHFGGVDLVAAMDRLICTNANPAKGCAAKGNYAWTSSVFAQALGILGQLRAGDSSGAARATTYLGSLQRGSGAFPSLIPSTDSGPDTDSTAMAAMALALVPGSAARTAVAKALKWLAGRQAADGGFPGASGDSTNSAALAIQALHLDAESYRRQIDKARAFLGTVQNSDGGFDLAADVDGSDLRASAQAVGGAVGLPYASLLDHLAAKAAAARGAHYLVGQLVDGNHYTTTFSGTTYDDQGLTADGVFALVAAGGHGTAVSAMVRYLQGKVDAYADTSGALGGPYSGSLAKLALVAEATGGDPHAFAGTDLLGILKSTVCTKAATDGTCTARGDFVSAYSGVSQALGVLALQASRRAADHLSAISAPVVRLHQLQCADGGFSSTLIAPGAACTSEVDTTGYAIQALAAVPGTDSWLGRAQQYLQHVQRSSGLYPGAAGNNSNSTAFAAQGLQTLVTALVSATADPPAPKAITPIVAWQSALRGLVGLSVSSGGFRLLAGDAGADLRASTQAVAAASQTTLLAVSGAPVRSTPRIAAPVTVAADPTPAPASTSAPAAAAAGAAAAPQATTATPLAATGVTTGAQLTLALLLLAIGLLLTYAGRRRSPAGSALGARHRVPD